MNRWLLVSLAASFLTLNSVRADDGDAIAALEQAGAIVHRDESQKGRPAILVKYALRQVTDAGNQALKEINEIPAIEFLGSGNSEMTTDTLEALRGKTSLKRFSISHAKINDESARILGTLTSLEALDLHVQIEMSPDGFADLLKLKNLRELTLSDRLVNDAVLEDLTCLKGLKELTIRSMFVTDDGIAALRYLTNLTTLRLFVGEGVTAEGLGRLSELQLKEVDITCFNVTLAKLKNLRKISKLKNLRLMNARHVTDEAIPVLSEMTELKELEMIGVKLSKDGAKELKNSLPNCKITLNDL